MFGLWWLNILYAFSQSWPNKYIMFDHHLPNIFILFCQWGPNKKFLFDLFWSSNRIKFGFWRPNTCFKFWYILPNRPSIPFSYYNILSLSTADMSTLGRSRAHPTASNRRSRPAPPSDTLEIKRFKKTLIAGTKSLNRWRDHFWLVLMTFLYYAALKCI